MTLTKAERKPLDTKHKSRDKKKKEHRITLTVAVAILIVTILISSSIINSMVNQPLDNETGSSTSQLKAVIVDHLSLTFPNQTFTLAAKNVLMQAGYNVDYYPGEQVVVDFYRNLPVFGYKLLILRVHSGFIYGGGTSIFLFTSEPYSTQKYVYEQLTDQIALARLPDSDVAYFGINENFVKSSMKGTFRKTIVLMMGCNGLGYENMAEAFIQKGAKAYVGWNASVQASHTDQAMLLLLQHLITEKMTLAQAVDNTMKEAGFDPTYNGTLTYYPDEAGEETIEHNIRQT